MARAIVRPVARRQPLVAPCLAAAVAALTAIAGCSDDAASPWFGATTRPADHAADTLYVANGSEPEYIDPGKCNDTGCAALTTQLFEGLTRQSPRDAHPVQGVAEAWEKSDDNRLYRF